MKIKKFTFKTKRSTGRYRSFLPNTHLIKLNKKCVGNISDGNTTSKGTFSSMLRVLKVDIMEDGNPNCDFKNITLKQKFNPLQEAKDFLNNNFDAINNKWQLKQLD